MVITLLHSLFKELNLSFYMLIIFCNVIIFCVASNTFWKRGRIYTNKLGYETSAFAVVVAVEHQGTKIYNQLFLLVFIIILIEKTE